MGLGEEMTPHPDPLPQEVEGTTATLRPRLEIGVNSAQDRPARPAGGRPRICNWQPSLPIMLPCGPRNDATPFRGFPNPSILPNEANYNGQIFGYCVVVGQGVMAIRGIKSGLASFCQNWLRLGGPETFAGAFGGQKGTGRTAAWRFTPTSDVGGKCRSHFHFDRVYSSIVRRGKRWH